MTTTEEFQSALAAALIDRGSYAAEDYNDDPARDLDPEYHIDWSEAVWEIPREGLSSSVGLIEVAENFGGEGQGEVRFIVFKLTNHDLTVQFFRIDGYYMSFSGSEFDGELREVKAVVRPVTFFE